eukprot:2077243-Amphidinium_carterae.3
MLDIWMMLSHPMHEVMQTGLIAQTSGRQHGQRQVNAHRRCPLSGPFPLIALGAVKAQQLVAPSRIRAMPSNRIVLWHRLEEPSARSKASLCLTDGGMASWVIKGVVFTSHPQWDYLDVMG